MNAIETAVERLRDEKRYTAPDDNGLVQLTYIELEALIAAGELFISMSRAVEIAARSLKK